MVNRQKTIKISMIPDQILMKTLTDQTEDYPKDKFHFSGELMPYTIPVNLLVSKIILTTYVVSSETGGVKLATKPEA
jgi:hypothetical protein